MKEKITKGIRFLVVAVLAFILCYSQCLYSFDKMVTDRIYQAPSVTSSAIKIIAIDERTIQTYGDISTWSREIPGQLVEKLNADPENAPAVIGFDVMYVTEKETEGDARFAKGCAAAGNVVTAVNVVTEDRLSLQADGSLSLDNMHVKLVEYPYPSLKEAADYGFANTTQDRDGYIRYGLWSMDAGEEEILSLSARVYQRYCEHMGISPQQPKLISGSAFGFTFSGKSGDYEVLSLCDVLDGKIDARVFRNSIVLVGAYAPGMQDSYNVAVQRGQQMYGVEIHANIIEALLEGKTFAPVSRLGYALTVTVIALAFLMIARRVKPIALTGLLVAVIALNVLTGKLLYDRGVAVGMVELPLVLILVYLYQVIAGYLSEVMKRRKVMNAFKKYVAPQVVEEISRKGDFEMVLGGENRHIAVLFVDIRGFTPMSESLRPEQVVEILNEYLTLTTTAIFKNGGTLDKFIGDATMAVFNAPFDLNDYIYRAVCTALDIAAGSDELEKKLLERFGKSVSFGIGVNCGPAVVGNIGCDFRMDYTAIGDTVNTAARLESNAKRGQILISSDVYQAVKDRIEANEIGVIPLKGKKDGALVYEVLGLKK
ncbi:MAG: adenylate/guanylate cyclase domain-containing protein [Oscillospiraceae bacterium]|nr:adenylate/guanylate cyclase domain-containing protein [Oscillospiraceae bacterium]